MKNKVLGMGESFHTWMPQKAITAGSPGTSARMLLKLGHTSIVQQYHADNAATKMLQNPAIPFELSSEFSKII